MGSGAWPFLVGGVICLVNSDNERDLFFMLKWIIKKWFFWIKGLFVIFKQMEVLGNNRSVMPLDVLGRTRATLTKTKKKYFWKEIWNKKFGRDGDRLL